MKINEITNEEVTAQELHYVERLADALWHRLGVDISFTHHFFDRVNDQRNGKTITVDELVALFRREYQANGGDVSRDPDETQAVFKDLLTNINIPFVVRDTRSGKKVVAKTVMRKPDFKSPDKAYVVR